MRGIAMIAAGLAGAAVAPAAPAGGQEEPVAEHHGRPANRLARETSPYLLQHAHNPVDWFAWGEEAFEEARRRNVPIFLSIGYSTCYWCHVMERESFEDEATGRLMSESFVCIKVDREERPDVDDIYMTATTAMTGRGGWPMSVFLTPPGASGQHDPGLKPFWCGTYFPPEPRHGMPAFTQVLRALSQAWKDQRGEIVEQAEALAGHLREALEAADGAAMRPAPIGAETVNQAAAGLLRMFDRTHGGFGGAPGQPKFPQPVFLEFLLDVLPSAGDEDTRTAIETAICVTLDRMAMGGMHDQVGGGFHRYSVDEKWLVPHFEKMLYDNAQLLRVYAREAARTGDAFHRGVAAEIVAYIRREMTTLGPDGGGFYSAQDAEVGGREGLNYLWTPTEVDAVFAGRPGGAEDAAFANRVFGLLDGPNFRDPHHPQEPASNVLFLAARPDVAAETPLARVRAAMLAARDARTQPRLDDKVIASWNGLMIGALADAGRLLGEASWVAMAERAAAFAWERLRGPDGALMRTWRAGRAKTPAMLEDYAALVAGFAAVHRARGDASVGGGPARAEARGSEGHWLERAEALAREARGLFCDSATGAWYDTRAGQRDLIVRGRSMHDGAVASAQSMMLHALLDLYDATGEAGWKTDAERLLASMSRGIAENPVGAINATRALLRGARPDGSLLGAVADAPVGGHEAPAPGDVGDAPEAIATPVGVFAATDRVSVRRGAPATLPIELRIDEGWHITAHEPFAPDAKPEDRIAGLVGLTVGMVGGEGLRARVEYPRGERLEGADGLPPLLVHTGSARLDIVIERTGAALSGAPILLVTYQACDDRACLEPVTVELDVAVDAE